MGPKFELIIDREVVAEDIGMYSCMANGSREAGKLNFALIVNSKNVKLLYDKIARLREPTRAILSVR